jgi:UDP-N-acetylglucosamine transferase subunit ALG13
MLAGSGDSLELLKKEFPQLPAFSLPAYRPRYPARGSMTWAMARQAPHFIRVIAAEHEAVEKLILREKVDRLISDNRYGCWSALIPAAFITHQSNILMPKRFGWLHPIVRRVSDSMISRFHACWIPDLPGDQSLAGAMSSFGPRLEINSEHIGWLSRFERRPAIRETCDMLAVFSGPEPQRTLFENMLLPQLKASGRKFRIVRGLPGATAQTEDPRIVNFLTSSALQDEIESAKLVIARSGYSTVMDLYALGKKAVFVPTPGQTEQEYLARALTERKVAFHMVQNSFDLPAAVLQSHDFSGFNPAPKNNLLTKAISRFIA